MRQSTTVLKFIIVCLHLVLLLGSLVIREADKPYYNVIYPGEDLQLFPEVNWTNKQGFHVKRIFITVKRIFISIQNLIPHIQLL